ncbi:Unknown protein [Striga hermonthica]|uniref:Retrotransposon Copia-like N-terminal domain-containing protein n=1 Tax=Striga hermonthica TaxID=68872 RepID=A0A9N7NL80_STRHE|nr:Unknown protein [Striga hermonthica]
MAEKSKMPAIDSPLYMYPSDSTGTLLTQIILTGENYSTWAKAVRRALEAKNKAGFVDGSVQKPDNQHPDYHWWNMGNSLVVSWILNSLDKSLQNSVVHAADARAILDELKERFSQGNVPRIHQLKAEINLLRQDGQSVTKYFTKLKGLWDELADYTDAVEARPVFTLSPTQSTDNLSTFWAQSKWRLPNLQAPSRSKVISRHFLDHGFLIRELQST